MIKSKLSYTESYTSFLRYCSDIEDREVDTLMEEFKVNGIEDKFKQKYDVDNAVNNRVFYKSFINSTKVVKKQQLKSTTSQAIVDAENCVWEQVSIMIELMMKILNCSYSDAYKVIKNSETYYYLNRHDFAMLYDSPQANLSSIGQELRDKHDILGNYITDENIIDVVWKTRQMNLMKRKMAEQNKQ
jgi:hypothetical protein